MNAGKSFPSDFYVTCATVIPVLYLALVLQGSTYEAMLRKAMHAAHAQQRRAALRYLSAYLAVAAGVLGEVFALVAVFMGSDTESIRVGVLIMTLIMVSIVAVGPTLRWWRAMREVTRDLRAFRRPSLSEDDQQTPTTPED